MPLPAVCERRGPWGNDGIGSGENAAATVGASEDAPHTLHATASGVLSVPQTAQTIERILSQRSFAEEGATHTWPTDISRLLDVLEEEGSEGRQARCSRPADSPCRALLG